MFTRRIQLVPAALMFVSFSACLRHRPTTTLTVLQT